MALITQPNLADPDGVYAALLARHRGLTPDLSAAYNARLILILMNHLGDEAVLEEALDLATEAGRGERPDLDSS